MVFSGMETAGAEGEKRNDGKGIYEGLWQEVRGLNRVIGFCCML
jgi:hypothetical protein